MSKFTTILHEPRKIAGLSMNEYVLTDTIHHLSRGRWCNMSRETMKDEFSLSKQGVINIISTLIEKGWIEKNDKGALRTTDKWEELIYTNGKESVPETVKKVYRTGKESVPNIYIDNNNINTIEETTVSFPIKPIKEKDKMAVSLISAFKEHIKKQGFIYSSANETVNAGKVVKNKEWQEACSSYGLSSEEMVVYIMNYTNSNECWWRGKVCSMVTFYYKWAILLSEMKTKAIAVPKNAKQEEEKKLQAEAFFNSL